MTADRPTGDDLVEMLAALANPVRLRILATLAAGRDYVSHLAREIGISRPLLHMHLQRLQAAGLVVGAPGLSPRRKKMKDFEAAGLVVGTLELSPDGKAMKYFEVAEFDLHVSAPAIAEAVRTLQTQEMP